MPFFSLSKPDRYRNLRARLEQDIIDIKFPSELRGEVLERREEEDKELLIFVVEDDPVFMQILNTHFSKLKLESSSGIKYKFSIKNFATGRSCLENMSLAPDIIFLNFAINSGLPNAIKGNEILDRILEMNPNQKVVILNDLDSNLRGAFVENGLRDYITKDEKAISELNNTLLEILDY